MINTPVILWLEWFDEVKANRFREATSKIWGLLIRNGMTSIVCKKWLREEISMSETDKKTSIEEVNEAEKKWLKGKNISSENFNKNRESILKENNLTETDFAQYCKNEIIAKRWACKMWKDSVAQIFLEKKDEFDKVKLEMLSVPIKNKGLALEVHQMLREQEIEFAEIGSTFKQIKYISGKEGTWFKKSELKKEIRYIVEQLKTEEYSKPINIDERLIVIGLLDVENAKLNSTIEELIIERELEKFMRYGIGQLQELGIDE